MDKLQALLGDLPADRPITATLLNEEEREGYRLECLLLDLNGIESVPAYVATPLQGNGPFQWSFLTIRMGATIRMDVRNCSIAALTCSSPRLLQP